MERKIKRYKQLCHAGIIEQECRDFNKNVGDYPFKSPIVFLALNSHTRHPGAGRGPLRRRL
jgi:hypothetical protein